MPALASLDEFLRALAPSTTWKFAWVLFTGSLSVAVATLPVACRHYAELPRKQVALDSLRADVAEVARLDTALQNTGFDSLMVQATIDTLAATAFVDPLARRTPSRLRADSAVLEGMAFRLGETGLRVTHTLGLLDAFAIPTLRPLAEALRSDFARADSALQQLEGAVGVVYSGQFSAAGGSSGAAVDMTDDRFLTAYSERLRAWHTASGRLRAHFDAELGAAAEAPWEVRARLTGGMLAALYSVLFVGVALRRWRRYRRTWY